MPVFVEETKKFQNRVPELVVATIENKTGVTILDSS